jgi:hypothetical protein
VTRKVPFWMVLAICSGGTACSGSQPTQFRVPADVICKLNALQALPDDPMAITAQNVANVVRAVQGCDLINRDAGTGL